MPASKGQSFFRAVVSSSVGTILSRVLGLLRDLSLTSFLGAGVVSDAFYVAFTIPNVFRRFVADEGLTGAIVPAVAKAEVEGDARPLVNTLFFALLIANAALCGFGIALAEPIVWLFAAAFAEDPEKWALTVTMTRWLFPFLAMVSVVSFAEGLLNHREHFFVPKLAPGLVSVGMIGAVFVASTWETGTSAAYAVVAGVLVGGVLHVLVNVPVLWKRWGPLGIAARFSDPRFRSVASELVKVVLIGVFAQVNIIVLRQLAASIGDGAVTWYWVANRLVEVAQGVFGVAIASAFLPQVSRSVAAGDWAGARRDLVRASSLAGFVLIPAVAVLGVFAEPITALLFRHGAYTWEDVRLTAATLSLMLPFMVAVAGMNLVKKVFFALEDRTPLLFVSAAGVALTAGLGWMLVGRLSVLGLALALSLSAVAQLAVHLWLLRVRMPAGIGVANLAGPYLKMVLASIPAMLVLWLASALGEWERGPASLVNVLLGVGGLTIAAASYALLARALGLQEMDALVKRIRRS